MSSIYGNICNVRIFLVFHFFSFQVKTGNKCHRCTKPYGRLAYMHVSLASMASHSFYGRLFICIPLKAELETGTWRQLIWEVIPGSRAGAKGRKAATRKVEKTTKTVLQSWFSHWGAL